MRWTETFLKILDRCLSGFVSAPTAWRECFFWPTNTGNERATPTILPHTLSRERICLNCPTTPRPPHNIPISNRVWRFQILFSPICFDNRQSRQRLFRQKYSPDSDSKNFAWHPWLLRCRPDRYCKAAPIDTENRHAYK